MIEQTYSMIKPDAIEFKEKIIEMIENGGFKILKSKEMKWSSEQAALFYIEHKGKPFYEPLIEFITSGNIFAMVLENENAIKGFRDFIGATDPKKAADGTIRKIYGTEISRNAIHGSDSAASAKREINLVFNEWK